MKCCEWQPYPVYFVTVLERHGDLRTERVWRREKAQSATCNGYTVRTYIASSLVVMKIDFAELDE